MAESFRQQSIVITGASEGIGRELALQLAAEGAWLTLASRNEQRLKQVAHDCTARGGRAQAVPTDVADPAACRELIEAAVTTFGGLHMLVNNAGISMYVPFAAVNSLEMLDRVLAVNFQGAVACTHYALPALCEAHGRIVVVSSLAAKILAPGATMYGASKAALRSFFDALRVELKADQVSVTMSYPGFIRTEIYKRFFDADGNVGPDRSNRIPSWTMMSVERCARRIIAAARARRRQVPPALIDWILRGLNRFARPLVERFWRRTLLKDFPVPDKHPEKVQ